MTSNRQERGGATSRRLIESFQDAVLADRENARSGQSTSSSWVDEESASGSAALRLRPGQMVTGTKYRVVRRIGTGGMGVVYEAVHINTDRRAALKVMRRDASRSPEAIAAFRQEARLASQIGSEHIAQALDFEELPNGRLMYVMELVDGDPVDLELVDGPMPAERVVAILRQAARGLSAAHDAGVVHRDIKPENIMLETDGDRRDHVRLLDFGVASISSSVQRGVSEAVGTPFYVAPEVIMGQPYGPAVDQYSLACAGYEMLSGAPPFTGDGIPAVLKQHMEAAPPPLSAAPAELASVIERGLAKNPDDRFPDMREFEAALIEAQVAAGIVTEWDHLPPPEVDPDRRASLIAALAEENIPPDERTRWVGIAIAVVVAIGAGAMLTSAFRGEEAEPESAPSVVAAPAEDTASLEAATRAARAAAAAGRYVYPPVDDPKATTAYAEIIKMEARNDPDWSARAAELRHEFATEIRHTADRYWAVQPDSELVSEYYAEVAMLLPEDLVAMKRSGLSEPTLAERRRRAAASDYEPEELLSVAPLGILMERDPDQRAARAAAYEEAVESASVAPKYHAEYQALLVVRSPTATPDSAPEGDPEAEAVAPEDAKLQANRLVERGQRALRQGRMKVAQGDFEKALELHPKLSAAHNGLAQVYFDRSNFRRASKHGRKAVTLSPGNLDYRVQLGDALYRLGRYEDALLQYEKAAARGRADAKRRAEKARGKL